MNHRLEQLFTRREYFNQHLPKLKGADRRNDIKGLSNTCPSCGYPTLEDRCAWEICSICFWEDDGQDDQDADEVFGGPNYEYSLTEHRIEWERNLNKMKNEDSETAQCLNKIDELIKADRGSVVPEIMELVIRTSELFDKQRNIQK